MLTEANDDIDNAQSPEQTSNKQTHWYEECGEMLRLYALAAALGATFMITACSGGADDSPIPFVFTPVPYTVVPNIGGPTYLITADDYLADVVDVLLEPDKVEAFTKAVARYGFTVEHVSVCPLSPCPPWTSAEVRVPPGAAPDALPIIQRQPGVIEAHVERIARLRKGEQSISRYSPPRWC